MNTPPEGAAQVLPGSTAAPPGEEPSHPDDKIVIPAYFVATTVRSTYGGVVAPLSALCMTVAKALEEHASVQAEYPRSAVLVAHLVFDPDDPAQMEELMSYLQQRETELGGAQ